MDSMKQWLIDIGLKEMGPSAIRGSLLAFIGWLAARNNLLPGIHTDVTAQITTIDWKQVSGWAVAAIPVVAGVIKAGNIHGTQALKAILPKQDPPSQP